MWRVVYAVSIVLNIVTGGRWGETFCSRVHRCGWVGLEVALDCAALTFGDGPAHCRRAAWASGR